jgi:hypothetical protein
LVELSNQQVIHHEGRVKIGGIYANWIRRQLATTLAVPNPLAP